MMKLNSKGQGTIELVIATAVILFVIGTGIKISLSLQKLFAHDFVNKPKRDADFDLAISKNLVFFKNKTEKEEFQQSHDPKSIYILKNLGIIL